MTMIRVQITRPLRRLIRDTRAPRMTQREAAEIAGMSTIWWRQVETGGAEFATARTVAKMCRAVQVQPAALRAIGELHLADLLEAPVREEPAVSGATAAPNGNGHMEAHIMATPELSVAQCAALVVMAQALRASVLDSTQTINLTNNRTERHRHEYSGRLRSRLRRNE